MPKTEKVVEKVEEKELNIKQKIAEIQQELKVSKEQKNTHGNYKYRSCEDIIEIVKPLCFKHDLLLTLSDQIVLIGDRYYIEARACLEETIGKGNYYIKAYARETESRKGMDQSQITGAASSYARKYALNGLFAIDDTKDADATNKHGKDEPVAEKTQVEEEVEEVLDVKIQKQINTINNIEDLKIYNTKNKDLVDDRSLFFTAITNRMNEIKAFIEDYNKRNKINGTANESI